VHGPVRSMYPRILGHLKFRVGPDRCLRAEETLELRPLVPVADLSMGGCLSSPHARLSGVGEDELFAR
jgi:hypothetical protein